MNDQSLFSPHRNFAENLMALCRRHGSIASVCRELDMNRQQFNKYLTGTVLPAPATLEKICAFFDIVPQTLFDDPRMFRGKHDVGISQASLDIISNLPPKSLNLAAHAIDSMNTTTLREGCYALYYPWPRDLRLCVRTAVVMYRRDGSTIFSRFTKLRELGSKRSYYLKGRHDGIVLESEGARYMIATNRKGFGELSLVSFGVSAGLSRDLLHGLALVMGASANPLALRATLEYQGSLKDIRKSIANAGLLPFTDPSLRSDVREAIEGQPGEACTFLSPFKLLDKLSTLTSRSSEIY